MKLTSRKLPSQNNDAIFLPSMRRYKYFPISREEEAAISQAVEACAVLAERMAQVGEGKEATSMFSAYTVLDNMKLLLKETGATRTTMGYN